jgi:hypothetical protein
MEDNVEVKLADVFELGEIIKLASKHPIPGYSCDFETYARFLMNGFNSSNFIFLVMKENDKVIGYHIFVFQKNIAQTVDVVSFDICLDKEYRRKGYILYFVRHIYKLANKYINKYNIENFKFDSHVLPEEYWSKLITCKYTVTKVYTIAVKDFLESLGEAK